MRNRILKNASWIIGSRILQAVFSLFISMLTARYLGPANYGLINYASSLVAFVTPIMQMGINSVLVHEIIKHPHEEEVYVGTAIWLNLLSSLLCIIGIVSFTVIVNHGEKETIIVCALYSVLLVFQSFEMLQYWFQAKLLSKYTSIISLVAYVVMSIYKIYLLITKKSVYWFALSTSIDYLVIAVGTYIVYRKLTNFRLKFSIVVGKDIIKIGKYYIISDLMVTIFAQTDRIMLKSMVGNQAVGFYSAAITCSLMTQFVFGAILDSSRPVILESKEISNQQYELNMKRLYAIIICLALIQSICITIVAPFMIRILYGASYSSTVSVLRILVWYTTFSYLGSARNIWILAERKQKYLVSINIMGAIANVILNLCFIPFWGINGAAFASLVTQIFTNVITGFILKPIRKTNFLMFEAVSPHFLVKEIQKFMNGGNKNVTI